MSNANEEKQVEMELTTVEEQQTTLRNRFSTKTEEGTSPSEEVQQPQETEQAQETEQPRDADADADADAEAEDSDHDPVDTPSESEEEADAEAEAEEAIHVQEDIYGREFITYQGIPYYREETSWNTPFAVQLSFSLIMVINLLNIALVIGQLASC